ncbi:phage terminase large subunit [Schlesneria sp.]|uniref:phage terminase large subunit n=1 Tax=Schlesneria sp. TaxID=2762018 RepID=UPI002EE7E4D8
MTASSDTGRMELAEVLQPHPGPQKQFIDSTAQIAVYGGQAGGGKTWALLAEAARYITVPRYGAVIFRRTSPQITNEGGLWDESMLLYPQLNGIPRHTLDWQFPTGDCKLKGVNTKDLANIGFRHLQYEKDKLAWQGSQITMLGFDELTHFTESQFFYMLSRNRSTCGIRSYVRATTNPVPEDDPIGGWVHRLVAWWIDPVSGLAIPERSGVVRWFVRLRGEFHWSDSRRDLIDRFGRPDLSEDHEEQPVQPKSFTFIPAKLSDNPALLSKDPMYRANLLALPEVERQRLAEGNWNAKARAGLFFKVGQIEIIEALPVGLRYCRAWDLAATDGSGDYTVGAKLGIDSTGIIYIADIRRGQWESSYRDQVIRQSSALDGVCRIRIPQDPAAAGKSEARRLSLMLSGLDVKVAVVSGDKPTRAIGFAAQLNAGNVKLLAGTWNQGLLQRLDAFPTKGIPDDEVDALADAFNELTAMRRLYVGI